MQNPFFQMEEGEENKDELPEELRAFAAGLKKETRKGLLNLAMACVASASENANGACEWAFCASKLFKRLERAGVKVAQLYFFNGWNPLKSFENRCEELGQGKFCFCYAGKSFEETAAALEKIRKTLQEMERENYLENGSEDTCAELEPRFFIKAKILFNP